MGDRQAAALSLRVHPQTVRYRLRQLQELYGEDWHDPALRLKLTLAVCWTPPNDVTALSR
jgi:DNA-binding PucR family transcriptional regulator